LFLKVKGDFHLLESLASESLFNGLNQGSRRCGLITNGPGHWERTDQAISSIAVDNQ